MLSAPAWKIAGLQAPGGARRKRHHRCFSTPHSWKYLLRITSRCHEHHFSSNVPIRNYSVLSSIDAILHFIREIPLRALKLPPKATVL